MTQHWSFRPLARLLRCARLVAWIAVGFAAAAGGLHLALPSPWHLYAPPRSDKLAMLETRRATANAAAFGSSRVQNGFDPSAFDIALAERGFPVTSLNLAIFGGGQTEQRALAREFVAHLIAPASAPCLVLLELNAGLNFQTINLFHPRTINLYDPDTVRFALRFSNDSLGILRRIGRAGFALAAGMLHIANVGMLGEALFEPVPDPPDAGNDALRGLLNEDPSPAGLAGVKQAFETRPSMPAPETVPILPGNREMLVDVAAAAAVSNVQLVYFVAPTLEDLRRALRYPDALDGPLGPVPVFNFAQPRKYPELFEAPLWRDPGHLSRSGAAMFSRMLGEEVGSWVAKNPRVSRCGD